MAEQKSFPLLAIVVPVLVVLIFLIAGFLVYENSLTPGQPFGPVACTQEARLCPDGSSVARTGPNCDFAQCPVGNQTAGWNVVTNNQYGFSLQYPNNFFGVGHEPKIFAGDCNYQVFPGTCPDINKVAVGAVTILPAGNPTTINGMAYCSYQIGDAAAGHQYYYDYYATVRDNKCLVVELDSSTTTCENYLPLEPGNTQQEQNYNDCVAKRQSRTNLLQQITSTFKFTQ